MLVINPGLGHLVEKVFLHLDVQSLLNCRLVCQPWMDIIDDPKFWLKKFKGKLKCNHCNTGVPKECLKLYNEMFTNWRDVIQVVEETRPELRFQIRKLLEDMYQGKSVRSYKNHFQNQFEISFQDSTFIRSPLNWVAAIGNKELVEFLLENLNSFSFSKTQNPWTPVLFAMENGHFEVVKCFSALQRYKENATRQKFHMKTMILDAIVEKRTDVIDELIQFMEPNPPKFYFGFNDRMWTKKFDLPPFDQLRSFLDFPIHTLESWDTLKEKIRKM